MKSKMKIIFSITMFFALVSVGVIKLNKENAAAYAAKGKALSHHMKNSVKDKKYSMKKFLRINMGMNYKSVENILGVSEKTGQINDKRELMNHQWKNSDDSYIVVITKNNYVVSKIEIGLEKINANISRVKYKKISRGMSYEKVKNLVGKGELLSETNLMGSNSKMYQWVNSDGSSMNITFTNGIVDYKTEKKLK
ncbi:hypothetical protein BJV85_001272 [Clostridium acetobutylicum]|uniref:DUF3862 domain-containing protein n=1 Tax=Clostridium acetobutylicum (strain ATCC 824 / DSM 792 / JCM 1419 / IAM 19013 / LMG 5710 / NBRC 13948 / NRRL B-527 / VKM B-1787 / 2291 / W) TaxID=272562 RepID=Q97FV8_CLOAB|nr:MULTISPECIES: DUF3862 domain-containing protein [Clostridium]AAK80565.1 Hypothetical protein, CF-17 family [Clostridium acetobutylicum ATCC 824]ADZ21664.1 conserved hypothetical protein [Clostridium acetobutylicum EA 2018]AEI32469.1 hypothetical protein SMB_G2653 [Clostridium acetobutylicum DSM 1731]AWV79018.1 DUF3862 domain-containing protein [Clostridium acetobutylicum]MBC2395022.1 DUF3862 domain-containing protein [Clostridium acetobutylicum]